MLTLRLTLAPPLALLLRLLLVCASAGLGLLLLATLSFALDNPDQRAAALVRLVWCLVPLAVTAHLAAALARTEPGSETRRGLDSAGLGPVRLPLLAARTAALPAFVGSALAVLVAARSGIASSSGVLTAPRLPDALARLPLAEQSLPTPAAATLLSTVPLLTALAAAWGARPGAPRPWAGTEDTGAAAASATGARSGTLATAGPRKVSCQAGLLVGAVLTAGGLLLAAYAARDAAVGGSLGLGAWTFPAGDVAASPLAGGWLLAAFGLVLAGPGLVMLSGRLLGAVRPGPVRLLAGRTLIREAPFLGRELGALSAVAAALVALVRARLTDAGAAGLPGPLVGASVVLSGCCVAGAALAALVRARRARAPLRELLARIGASRKLARAVTLVRACVTLVVFAGPAVLAGMLTALPPH
ncbi:hypothetical protein [Streptomyces spirodelae]|uniref:Integral membrane protein n=1 Tax=Streptomyces spirodelae TaxID=2812904 RepID=A0ABS3X0N5_9ACTN|nr:hypothetical protein [Streptomyces spirodelae]MBO8188955.1 hypothetical protein [Streptomyces spirodelae]